MVAIDEAKLDKLYQKVSEDKEAIVSEIETLKRGGREYRRMLRKQNEERRVIRKKRASEVMQAAVSIFDWLVHFEENPKGRKVLSTLEYINLFYARYHNCKPTEWEAYNAWLTYDYKGILRYRETCGDMRSWQIVLANPEQMVRQLHPDYILAVLDEITSGRVWEQIELSA